MSATLEDPDTLARQARRPLIAAAALASAVLAPLVDELVLGGLTSSTRIDWQEILTFWVWGAALGALFGGLAMRAALRPGRGPAAALGFAVIAGIFYPVCLLALPALASLPTAHAQDLLRIFVIGPLAVTFLGALVSIPVSVGFGLAFAIGSLHARTFVDRPAFDQVAHGWTSAAVLLGVTSVGAGLLAAMIEASYCQAIFFVILPALDVVPPEGTDVAWTRLVLFPAPLVLAASGALLRSALEHWRVRRLARSLAAGVHPTLVLDESPTETEADGESGVLPLRETDAGAKRFRLVRRRDDGSPFREPGRALSFVAEP